MQSIAYASGQALARAGQGRLAHFCRAIQAANREILGAGGFSTQPVPVEGRGYKPDKPDAGIALQGQITLVTMVAWARKHLKRWQLGLGKK